MPLKKLGQVNRTILFESFNPEVDDLRAILKNDYERFSDESLSKIKEKLFVKNFNEFLKKFKPTIYVKYVEPNTDDLAFDVEYTLEKPEDFDPDLDKAIVISDHELWGAILNLYTSKGKTTKSDFDFDFNSILKILTPERDKERMKEISDDLAYCYREYKALPLTSPNKAKFAKKIKFTLEKIEETLDNPIQMLTLSIAETGRQLKLLGTTINKDENLQETKSLKQRIMIAYDEKGNIKPIQVEQSKEGIGNPNSKEDTRLIELIGKGFEEKAPKGIKESAYVKDMVVSTYANRALACIEVNEEELKQKNDVQLNTYKNVQEKFIGEVMILAEKMMGVKAFFDHATINGELKAGLLVTNCKLRTITENEEINKKFKEFIENINQDYNERFYFSIIPNIKTKYLERDVKDREEEENKKGPNMKMQTANEVEAVTDMIHTLAENKVLSFINLAACKETSFKQLNEKQTADIRELLKGFGNDSEITKQISFVYPNFTLLPDSVGHIELGNKYGEETYIDDLFGEEYVIPEEDRKCHMQLPGVYIDAGYIAAGIVAGYQDPEYLENLNYKVKKFSPGVRFNLEECYSGGTRGVFAKFNKDSSLAPSFKLKEDIDKDNLGFCFWRDKNFDKISILKARTVNKDEETGEYQELHKTLVENFIKIYISSFSDQDTEKFNAIIKAFNDWRRERGEEKLNILQGNDDIEIIKPVPNENTATIALQISNSKTSIKFQVNTINMK